MYFDKNKDHIAITIPKFRMRKGADLGKNEIGIVSIAIDSSGVSNPLPSVFTNSFYIPKVKKWTWVKFGGHGRIIYGPKNPGSFVYYNVLFVESDQDVREFGETLNTIFQSKETTEILKLLSSANPTSLLVSTVVSELGKLVGKILEKNKNDLIYSTEGSLLQGIDPPYNVGDRFTTLGEHIECEVKILPIQADNNLLKSNELKSLSAISENGEKLTTADLQLEMLSGVPQVLEIPLKENKEKLKHM